MALKKLLTSCCGVPGLPIIDLHGLCVNLRNNKKLPVAADRELLTGICMVINHQKQGQLEAVTYLIDPIISLIEQLRRENKLEAVAISNNIILLTAVLNTIKVSKVDGRGQVTEGFPQEHMTEVFTKIVPYLQMAITVCPNEDVAEKVCWCYKHAIRQCDRAFLPYLGAMAQHLVSSFQEHPYSAFIYAVAICIKLYVNVSDEARGTYTLTLTRRSYRTHSFARRDLFSNVICYCRDILQ